MWIFHKSSSACVILYAICHKNILTHDTILSGSGLALGPLICRNVSEYAEWTFTYYHRDTKVTRKLFITGQRPCAVTLLLLVLPGLWSSLSLNRVHYSSPGVSKNGFFSLWPGVTHPTIACSSPPPSTKSWTNSHSSHPCDGDPGATSTLFTPASCKRWLGMMDYSKAQEHCCPKYSTRCHTLVLFSIQAQCLWRKCSWQAQAFYVRTQMVSGWEADSVAAGENHSWVKRWLEVEILICFWVILGVDLPPLAMITTLGCLIFLFRLSLHVTHL